MSLTPQDLIQLGALYIVFLFSTTLHEAAHAFTAKWMGDDTAALGGQASLDPRPHVMRAPVGMVLLPLIGLLMYGFPIGFASAPYNVEWALRYPRRAGLMALAGPVSNLLLCLVSAVGIVVFFRMGLAYPAVTSLTDFAIGTSTGADAVLMFLEAFFALNLLLAVLNMLPFPPLDGSAVINIALGDRHGRSYQVFLMNSPWIAFVGLLLVWNLIGRIFSPVFAWAISTLVHLGFGG